VISCCWRFATLVRGSSHHLLGKICNVNVRAFVCLDILCRKKGERVRGRERERERERERVRGRYPERREHQGEPSSNLLPRARPHPLPLSLDRRINRLERKPVGSVDAVHQTSSTQSLWVTTPLQQLLRSQEMVKEGAPGLALAHVVNHGLQAVNVCEMTVRFRWVCRWPGSVQQTWKMDFE